MAATTVVPSTCKVIIDLLHAGSGFPKMIGDLSTIQQNWFCAEPSSDISEAREPALQSDPNGET